MPVLDWYTSDQIPDRSFTLPPRSYVKIPLEGNAVKIPTYPEQPPEYTRVFISGSSIVADNGETLNLPLSLPVTSLDAAYDQLSRLWCAYIEDGEGKLYWYDAFIAGYTTFLYGPCSNVFLFMDDVRYYIGSILSNAVFLVYQREQTIYYRVQDDRFLVEYTLAEVAEGETLRSAGMNGKYRIQLLLDRDVINESAQYGQQITYTYVINDVPLKIDDSFVVSEVTNEYNNPP